MNLVKIKPLSVNKAWQGRRFKTDEYKSYEQTLLIMLPNIDIPEGELQLTLEFGFSSKASDFDNPLKPFIDCMQKRYGFNDKLIKRCVIDINNDVKKGAEYIKFLIEPIKAA